MFIESAAAYIIYKYVLENMVPVDCHVEDGKTLRPYRKTLFSLSYGEVEEMKESVGKSMDDLCKVAQRYCRGARWENVTVKPMPKKDTTAVILQSRKYSLWLAARPNACVYDPFIVAGLFVKGTEDYFQRKITTRLGHGRCGIYFSSDLLAVPENFYRDGYALFQSTGESEVHFEIEPYGIPGSTVAMVGKESRTDPRKTESRRWFERFASSGAETHCDRPVARVAAVQYAPAGTYAKFGGYNRSKLCLELVSGEKSVVVNIRNEFHESIGYVTEKRQAKLRKSMEDAPVILRIGADGRPTEESLKKWFERAGLVTKE